MDYDTYITDFDYLDYLNYGDYDGYRYIDESSSNDYDDYGYGYDYYLGDYDYNYGEYNFTYSDLDDYSYSDDVDWSQWYSEDGSDIQYDPMYASFVYDDYYYSDIYYFMSWLYTFNLDLKLHMYSLSWVLLLSFVIVFISDHFKKQHKLRQSFFVITFIHCITNIYFLLYRLYLHQNFFDVPPIFGYLRDIAYVFDGYATFIIGLNRFTAILFPIRYRSIWSIRNSLIIVFVIFLICTAESLLYSHIDEYDDELGPISNFLSYFFPYKNFTLAVICLILNVFSVPKSCCSKSSQPRLKAMAERRLLYISLYYAILHCYLDIYGTIKTVYFTVYAMVSFGMNFNTITEFITTIVEFLYFGGVIIVLFITRYAYHLFI